MMRPALTTLAPMLAAALAVLLGGERLARREVVTAAPADRDRLLDFGAAFGQEVKRLDDLYLSHLRRIAAEANNGDRPAATKLASDVPGVRLVKVFRRTGRDEEIKPGPAGDRLPEVEMEGRGAVLDPKTARVVPARWLGEEILADGEWLAPADAAQPVFCTQPEPGVVSVVLVDPARVNAVTESYLREWTASRLVPLREAAMPVAVENARARILAASGGDGRGPSSALIPVRALFEDWRIHGWDKISVSRRHDPATVAASVVLAFLLVAAGVVLFVQQQRALRLAAQRVSFVNRVSHELGSPLTNISLNLDLAADSLTAQPAEARHRLALAGEEIGRLARLVANVLTFSRRERRTLALKPAPARPDEAIRRAVEAFRPALARRGMELEAKLEAETVALLDADALEQIVGNLLSNALKYAADGRWVGVESRMVGEQIEVTVRDRGPGIPRSERDHIFEPFARVSSATSEGSSGTGLGLSIGRELAALMGGSLVLLDSDSGAVFQLRVAAPPALRVVANQDSAA